MSRTSACDPKEMARPRDAEGGQQRAYIDAKAREHHQGDEARDRAQRHASQRWQHRGKARRNLVLGGCSLFIGRASGGRARRIRVEEGSQEDHNHPAAEKQQRDARRMTRQGGELGRVHVNGEAPPQPDQNIEGNRPDHAGRCCLSGAQQGYGQRRNLLRCNAKRPPGTQQIADSQRDDRREKYDDLGDGGRLGPAHPVQHHRGGAADHPDRHGHRHVEPGCRQGQQAQARARPLGIAQNQPMEIVAGIVEPPQLEDGDGEYQHVEQARQRQLADPSPFRKDHG